jgi:hypothetical protein
VSQDEAQRRDEERKLAKCFALVGSDNVMEEIMKNTFKAALVSALLITASPVFASGGDKGTFAIVGGGSMKCKAALKEMRHGHGV